MGIRMPGLLSSMRRGVGIVSDLFLNGLLLPHR